MADIPFPKSPGGASFGTIDRFKMPKARSPGPAEYANSTSTLSFSSSMLSTASSQPSFAFSAKFALPGELAKSREVGKGDSELHIPGSIGPQVSSRLTSKPAFSMGPKHRSYALPHRAVTPGPLSYSLPSARVYHERGERNLGSDDRFGDSGPRSSVYIPHASEYNSTDSLTRTDTYTRSSHPFTGRPTPSKVKDRSPGPCAEGEGAAAKFRIMHQGPTWSMGLKDRPETGAGRSGRALEPSPLTYQARSLYWTNKKTLGRSATALGRTHSASGLSIHRDVQRTY